MTTNERGLTILEVLLSIAILGIITLMVNGLLANGIRASSISQERMNALFAAQNCLEDTRVLFETNCAGGIMLTPTETAPMQTSTVQVIVNNRTFDLTKRLTLLEEKNGGDLIDIQVEVSRDVQPLASTPLVLNTTRFVQHPHPTTP